MEPPPNGVTPNGRLDLKAGLFFAQRTNKLFQMVVSLVFHLGNVKMLSDKSNYLSSENPFCHLIRAETNLSRDITKEYIA